MPAPSPRVWVASYGGSGTNWLNDAIKPNVVDRGWWGPGPCHAPAPIADAPCSAAVYIYRHPVAAYRSQERRGLLGVNQRKLGYPAPHTPQRMARAMIEQMIAWAHAGDLGLPFPVVLVRYERLPEHLDELAAAVGVPIPRTFTPRRNSAAPVEGLGAAVHVWRALPHFAVIPAAPAV